jgi:hypothetical protein
MVLNKIVMYSTLWFVVVHKTLFSILIQFEQCAQKIPDTFSLFPAIRKRSEERHVDSSTVIPDSQSQNINPLVHSPIVSGE